MSGSRRRSARRLALLIVAAALTRAPIGLAHIDLTQPVPREQGRRIRDATNADLKAGPCGQRSNGRTDKVNVFSPGQTIEVTWTETTNHPSYYRLAFDLEGDDGFPLFAGPGIGQEGDDPIANCPIDGRVILAYELDDRAGGSHTLEITLPDVECENCTLQLVQYMYGSRSPYYFQCADLALRRVAAGAPQATSPDGGALDAADVTERAPPYGEAFPELGAASSCSQRLALDGPEAPDSGGGAATGNATRGNEPTGDPSGETAAHANAGAPAADPGARADAGCQLTGIRNQSPFNHLLNAALLTLGLAASVARRR
jgi:hypothetical protein